MKHISGIMFWVGVGLTAVLGCFGSLIISSIFFAFKSWGYRLCMYLLGIFVILLIIDFGISQFNNMVKENYRMTTNARRIELCCLLLMLLMIIIINIPSSFSVNDFIGSLKDAKEIWTSAGVVGAITIIGNYFFNPKLLMIQIWGTPTYQKSNRLYLPYSNKKFSLVLHNYSSKKYRITFLGIFKKADAKKILQKRDWYNLHYPNTNLIKNPRKLEILDKNCDSRSITINTQKLWKYFEIKPKSNIYYCDNIRLTCGEYYSELLKDQGIKIFKETHKKLYNLFFNDYKFRKFKRYECDEIKEEKSMDLCAVYYVENNKTGNNLITKHFIIEK